MDFSDDHFIVTLDGKEALGRNDKTFTEAGKADVWTKADSVTLFDDFTYDGK